MSSALNDKTTVTTKLRQPTVGTRVANWLRAWYWLISIVLILISLGLGFVGYREYLGPQATAFDALYKTFKIAGLGADVSGNVPWTLEVSRFATPLLFAHAVFLGLGALFRERYNLARLLWWRNHIVICGLGKKGLLLAKALREQGHRVVVIDNAQSNAYGDEFRFRDIILLHGDAQDLFVLRRAAVQRARFLFALTGSDGRNAEIAMQARTLIGEGASQLTSFAHIHDLELCRFLREREVESVQSSPVKVEFFCIYETGARNLLDRHPFIDRANTEHEALPQIVVVGPGRFGSSLVLQSARAWRNSGGNQQRKLRITIVDRGGAERLERLRSRFPQINSVCEFEVIPLDTLAPDFARGAFLFDINGNVSATAIYICFDDESAGLTAAFTLNRACERRGASIPIIIRMSEASGFAAMFSASDDGGNIRAFHLLDETCTPERLCVSTNELIAQALHAEYVRSVAATGAPTENNPATVQWDKLSEPLKESNRHQAAHLARRLQRFGYQIVPLSDWEAENFAFADVEVDEMARMEHERWCADKKRAGITYAPGTRTKKTHPNLVPWEQLDEETQDKARAIVRAAPRVLASVGFQVERLQNRVRL
ncbi:MAG: NAD-binding protein [Candidatus Hydrogenedentes bacterium]|nr:NAD-binding protein [Candidatus Hydrogenedentota bacterium]